jgi:hypothetical protein
MNSSAPKVHPFFAILSGILEVSSAIFVISSFMLQQLTYFCDFVDFINYFFILSHIVKMSLSHS